MFRLLLFLSDIHTQSHTDTPTQTQTHTHTDSGRRVAVAASGREFATHLIFSHGHKILRILLAPFAYPLTASAPCSCPRLCSTPTAACHVGNFVINLLPQAASRNCRSSRRVKTIFNWNARDVVYPPHSHSLSVFLSPSSLQCVRVRLSVVCGLA